METVSAFARKPDASIQANETNAPENVRVLAKALSSAQSLRAFVGLKLAPLGLAAGQDRVLLALQNRERMTVSALADALNVRPSTVSKMMDRLSHRGLTVRSHDDGDHRRTHVALTDEGKAVCERLCELCEAIEAELQADLAEGDAKVMADGLSLLETAVSRRLRRMR